MTASNSDIKLVCFDLGGVVLRICRTWEEGCRAAGLEMRGENWNPFGTTNGWHAGRELTAQYQTGRLACDEFSKLISESQPGLFTPQEIRRVHDAWILHEYEGVGEMIDRIHAAGLSTATLSNTNHAHWIQCGQYPAIKKIRHLLASHLLGLQKPDAAIYHEAQRLLGVRGKQILFFDDLPDNIAAARASGWNAHQIDPANDTAGQMIAALGAHGVTLT